MQDKTLSVSLWQKRKRGGTQWVEWSTRVRPATVADDESDKWAESVPCKLQLQYMMAAISQNCCCGEAAASIWGDVSVCLSQRSSLQAFHHHVVFCLSSPSPSSSPPLFGYIPVTAPLSSSTPPAPHCSVRSPALFVQMEQKRKWKPESTVNPFLGLCSTIVCIPVVFHLVCSMLLMMMICIPGGSRRVGSFRVRYGEKIT